MGECGCECIWPEGDCEYARLRVSVSVPRPWVSVSVPGPRAGVSGVQGPECGASARFAGLGRGGVRGRFVPAQGVGTRVSGCGAVAAGPRGPGFCSTAGRGALGRSPAGAGIPSVASRLREWCGWRQCSVPRAAREAGCASWGSGRLLF